jgi:Family of unknown function (DUF6492)
VTSWAVITPSYKGDFERCKLLCKSLDAFVTGEWHHYIVVETVDLELFAALQGPRRTIVHMESILPKWMYHLKSVKFLSNRSIWFAWRTGFMVGWQIQQIVKFEMAFRVKEDGLLYCDSDVFFVRPFDVNSMNVDGAFRFYGSATAEPRETASNAHYMVAASKQLGLGADPFPCRDYVDNLVTWHAPTARAACARMTEVSGKDWRVSLGRHFVISEYAIYGMYVDRLAQDQSLFAKTSDQLCKTIWKAREIKDVSLDDFCNDLKPGQVALGFQSFAGVSMADLADQLDKATRHFA